MSTATIQNLQIVSATYGSSDMTSFVQKQLAYYLNANQNATSWVFAVGTDFFLVDPNPNVLKMCVVVYRYLLGGSSTYSIFQSAFAPDGSDIMIVPTGHTFATSSDPTPGASNESIVTALWYSKDVTDLVKQQFQSSTGQNPEGTPITVSTSTLGPDPAPGRPKQLTVVYGRYINGRWYYCTKVDLNPAVSWTLLIPPAVPALQDRRLNIYSATWGGQDYTDYVRSLYIADTILHEPPTSTSNKWAFFPDEDFFGPDPNPGTQKMFVLVYRVARLMGVQKGQLTDFNAPPVWTQAWYDTKPPMLETSNYPILGDVSGFRCISGALGSSLHIDLSQADMTPLEKPLSWKPWIVNAVWSSIDVTANINSQVAQQTAQPPTSITGQLTQQSAQPTTNTTGQLAQQTAQTPDSANPDTSGIYSITVSSAALGRGDPWPNVAKQLTLTVGYPTKDEVGYEMQTFVQLNAAVSWTMQLPAYMPPRAPQWPQPFRPALYRHVTFVDHGLSEVWPQVWQNGKVVWCPRPSNTELIVTGGPGPFALTARKSLQPLLVNPSASVDAS